MENTDNEVTQSAVAQLQRQLAGNGPALDKLAPAFVRAWGAVGMVTKDAHNPHFGSDYATLAATMAVIKPAFAANELALITIPGPLSADRATMTVVVLHSSGQRITATAEAPLGGKFTAQSLGSALQYLRRYVAQAITGIAAVDDDGAAASEPPPKVEKPKAKVKEIAETMSGKPTEAAEEISYAKEKQALLDKIAAVKVPELNKLAATAALDEIKESVREINDDEVARAYVDKKKEVRASKS